MKPEIKFTEEDFNQVEDNLFNLLKKLPKKVKDEPIPKGDLERNFRLRLFLETSFMIKIACKLNYMISTDTQTVLLWDVDEVLGNNNKATGKRVFEVRPAIPVLFQKIKETFPKIIFGILSSRGQEHLEVAIVDKKTEANFATIGNFFDPKFIFSTYNMGGVGSFNDPDSSSYTEELRSFRNSFLFQKKSFSEGSVQKSVRIMALQKEYPNVRFIPIDDIPYAEFFGGICLEENEKYRSIFQYASTLPEILNRL